MRLTTGVSVVELDGDGAVRGVVLRSGEALAADFVVLAVPFDRVRGLIPEQLRGRLPALAHLDELRSAPITGVHLWFDRPVCPFDHVVTPGRLIQWVFNHTAIQGRTAPAAVGSRQAESVAGPERSPGEGQYLQVVISASYDLLALDKVAIRDAVLAELAAIWPAARARSSCGGGSSPSTGRRSLSDQGSRHFGPLSARRSTDSSWRATGPTPAGRPRWKGRFAVATWPPRES